MDIWLLSDNFEDMVPETADQFNTGKVSAHSFELDDQRWGRFKMEGKSFPNGLEYLHLKGCFNEKVTFKRPEQDWSKNLVFNTFKDARCFTQKDGERFEINNPHNDLLFVYNTYYSFDIQPDLGVNFETLNVKIGGTLLNTFKDLSGNIHDELLESQTPLFYLDSIRGRYKNIFKQLEELEEVVDPYHTFMKSTRLLDFVCSSFYEMYLSEQILVKKGLNNQHLHTALHMRNLLLKDMSRSITIEEISSEVGLSPTLAKNIFKQVFGQPIFTFYQENRMKEAQRLLQEDKMSVSEIGYAVGYTHLGYFAKAFKKYSGCTPKQYRLQYLSSIQ